MIEWSNDFLFHIFFILLFIYSHSLWLYFHFTFTFLFTFHTRGLHLNYSIWNIYFLFILFKLTIFYFSYMNTHLFEITLDNWNKEISSLSGKKVPILGLPFKEGFIPLIVFIGIVLGNWEKEREKEGRRRKKKFLKSFFLFRFSVKSFYSLCTLYVVSSCFLLSFSLLFSLFATYLLYTYNFIIYTQ